MGAHIRVFLSYARNDRGVAELVAQSLIERGHKVFFDGNNLPAGETYEDQIEAAVERAGLFVFLVSPHSVEDGRFTRTEIVFAQKKWPSAKDRVLPVIITPTEFDTIPAYLRAVSILEPEGNIPAEVAAAVDRLARRRPRLLKLMGCLVLLAATAYAGWSVLIPKSPKLKVEAFLQPYERGIFDREPINKLSYTISNIGAVATKLLWVELQARPKDTLTIVRQSEEVDLLTGQPIGADGEHEGYFAARINTKGNNIEVRACAEFDNAPQTCSPWTKTQAFQPHEYLYGNAFDLPDTLKPANAVIGTHPDGFLMAVGQKLYSVSETGVTQEEQSLPALISALYHNERVLYAAAGNQVYKLDSETFEQLMRFDSINDSIDESSLGETISPTIDQFAHDGEHLWYTTSSQTGKAGMFFADPDTGQVERVPYYEEIDWDIDGFRLRSGDRAVWSGETNSTPTSLYKFEAESHTIFSGHDYDALSCATDAFETFAGPLLVPDCNGNIFDVSFDTGTPQINTLGSNYDTLGYGTAQSDWSSVVIDQTRSGLRFAIVTTHSNENFGGDGSHEVVLNRIGTNQGSQMAFNMTGAQFLAYAVAENTVMLKLKSDEGKIENVPISILPK